MNERKDQNGHPLKTGQKAVMVNGAGVRWTDQIVQVEIVDLFSDRSAPLVQVKVLERRGHPDAGLFEPGETVEVATRYLQGQW